MLITEILREKYNFVNNVYEVYDYENCIDKEFLEYCLTTDQNQDGLSIKIKNGRQYKLTIIDDNFVIINIMKFNILHIGGEKINGRKTIISKDYTILSKISINNQGLSFIEYNNHNRFVPLRLKNLNTLKRYKFIDEIIKIYFEYIININSFFKEFLEEYKQNNYMILPIEINKLFDYHNKKDMFINVYKGANKLSINYNKRNINNSYCLIKLVNYVDEKSLKMLINLKCFNFSHINNIVATSVPKALCIEFYKDKFKICECDEYNEVDEFLVVIEEYINMARKLRLKINLNLTKKGVIKEHNKLEKIITNKKIKSVKIAKNLRVIVKK